VLIAPSLFLFSIFMVSGFAGSCGWLFLLRFQDGFINRKAASEYVSGEK
jgi:hypothetical protein